MKVGKVREPDVSVRRADGRLELDPSRLDRRRTAGVRELIIDETVDKATGNVNRRVRLRMADRKDALVKLIAGLAENPATAAIADAAREALTQGVSVAAWLGVAALIIGFLTTIPLGRRAAAEAEAATQAGEPEAEAKVVDAEE